MNNLKQRQAKHMEPLQVQNEKLRGWFNRKNRRATILEDYDFTDDMNFVANVYEEYISTAAKFIATSSDAAVMHRAVESFIESPVVRSAFGAFKDQCYAAGFTEFLDNELADALRASAPAVDDGASYLNRVDSLTGFAFPKSEAAEDDRQQLRRIVTEYLVRIESWRRAGLAHGHRHWTFGARDEVRIEFLGSTLLQLWLMNQEGCFSYRRAATDCRDWELLWEKWAEKCCRLDAADTVELAESEAVAAAGSAKADETEVFVGVGWRPDGWLQKT